MAKVVRSAHAGARKNILELTEGRDLVATDTGKTILQQLHLLRIQL